MTDVTADEDAYLGEHHVYEPHRVGVPNLRHYFSELWRRRDFALELARTQMEAQHTDTVLGKVWLVLNPLLLAGVYFLLISIIAGHGSVSLAQITGGLFLYYFISGGIQTGTNSIIAGGRLILNMAFPKMLLPMSSVYQAFRRFLPTLVVYAVIHLIWQRPITWHLLWLPLILVLATLFAFGVGMVTATVQVYFRDMSNFLPYFLRIWLYLSPVLWTTAKFHEVTQHFGMIGYLNPLFSIIGAWNSALDGTGVSGLELRFAVGWTIAALVAGTLLFLTREREFSVRL